MQEIKYVNNLEEYVKHEAYFRALVIITEAERESREQLLILTG